MTTLRSYCILPGMVAQSQSSAAIANIRASKISQCFNRSCWLLSSLNLFKKSERSKMYRFVRLRKIEYE
jgi:hypothetical protein